VYISRIWGEEPPAQITPKCFLAEDVGDVITWFKFGDDRLRGFGSAECQSLPFPIDVDGRPYNTLTLPCERLILVLLDVVESVAIRLTIICALLLQPTVHIPRLLTYYASEIFIHVT